MDILEKYGVKIFNVVLIKYVTNTETDKVVADFLTGYGSVAKFEVKTDTDCIFHNCIIF